MPATRILVLFLTVALVGIFGQTGLYGPVTAHVKAGDFAPELVSDRTWGAAGREAGAEPNLFGQLTVVAFFPDTSHNPQASSEWNALVTEFAGKPVQFVWITGEADATLAPWLAAHPMQGGVLRAASGATGRAYGLDLPAAVFIGEDRRILGFDRHMVPSADTLRAALEGRTTVTSAPQPSSAEFRESAKARKVLLAAEAPRMPRPDDHKPDFPPSYTPHISPSQSDGSGNFGGMDSWSLQGMTLRAAIAEIHNLQPIRIQLPASLDDDKRYDFALVLPESESKEQIYERFRQGIDEHFHVTATREERLTDVYLVTVTNKKPPAAKRRSDDDFAGFSSAASLEFETVDAGGDPNALPSAPKTVSLSAVRGISMEGTMEEFCRMLEQTLDRPVVNESGLTGEFAFQVETKPGDKNEFLARLRDELGITIEPAQRSVEMLVFRER